MSASARSRSPAPRARLVWPTFKRRHAVRERAPEHERDRRERLRPRQPMNQTSARLTTDWSRRWHSASPCTRAVRAAPWW